MSRAEPLALYFYRRVHLTEGCWEWTGCIDKTLGYGNGMYNGRAMKAHRLSWTMFHGSVPSGLSVLHHCDNRRCVNPTHLWLGTQKDNQQDAVRKNRSARGERNGMSILSADDVRSIRSAYTGKRGELTRFARRYGVSAQAIAFAVKGRNWAWVS